MKKNEGFFYINSKGTKYYFNYNKKTGICWASQSSNEHTIDALPDGRKIKENNIGFPILVNIDDEKPNYIVDSEKIDLVTPSDKLYTEVNNSNKQLLQKKFFDLEKFLESLKSYEKSTNEINIEIVPEELSVWEDEEWSGEIEGEFFTFKATTTYRHPTLGLELGSNEEKLKKFLNLLNENGIKDLDSSKLIDCEFWINLNSSSGQFTEVISDSIKFENDIDSEQKEDFCSILTDEETDLWEYAEVDEGIISFEKGSIKKIILAINNDIFELII